MLLLCLIAAWGIVSAAGQTITKVKSPKAYERQLDEKRDKRQWRQDHPSALSRAGARIGEVGKDYRERKRQIQKAKAEKMLQGQLAAIEEAGDDLTEKGRQKMRKKLARRHAVNEWAHGRRKWNAKETPEQREKRLDDLLADEEHRKAQELDEERRKAALAEEDEAWRRNAERTDNRPSDSEDTEEEDRAHDILNGRTPPPRKCGYQKALDPVGYSPPCSNPVAEGDLYCPDHSKNLCAHRENGSRCTTPVPAAGTFCWMHKAEHTHTPPPPPEPRQIPVGPMTAEPVNENNRHTGDETPQSGPAEPDIVDAEVVDEPATTNGKAGTGSMETYDQWVRAGVAASGEAKGAMRTVKNFDNGIHEVIREGSEGVIADPMASLAGKVERASQILDGAFDVVQSTGDKAKNAYESSPIVSRQLAMRE